MKKDMLANDLKETVRSREEIRQAMADAFKANDPEAYASAAEEMQQRVAYDVRQEYEQKLKELEDKMDEQALAQRGIKPLTSEEKRFYDKFAECVRSRSPQQAITSGNLVMPETVLNRVFDELQTDHPLLRRLNFIPVNAKVKIIVNTNGFQAALWGELCDEITREALAGFAMLDATLCKLSAFLPVCKAMMELGPVWLDNFVRQTLYEMFANGLELGFVDGTGKDQPIGMTRQVGAGVVVTDGVYPRKTKIAVNDLSPATIGNLVSLMAVDPNGKPRRVRDLLLIVNPQDYFQRVMPATTIMAPDGTYRNDVLPYPMTIVQSPAVSVGDAVFGIGYRYAALIGSDEDGRIEYSDHYQFLEDKRVYLIKGYGNGLPLDNNAFQYLDITGLTPLAYRVNVVDAREPSDDATLTSLKIGNKALTPTFDAATTSYTAATTDATNTVTAQPADAGASVVVELNGEIVPNGSAVTWSSANSGVNTLSVTVTAEDGTTQKTYTVTVTKS